MMWWWMFWCTMDHSSHHHGQNHNPSQAPHGHNDRRVLYLQLPWRLSIITTSNMNRKVINTLVRTGTVVPKMREKIGTSVRWSFQFVSAQYTFVVWLFIVCEMLKCSHSKEIKYHSDNQSWTKILWSRIASSIDIYVDPRLRHETKYICLSRYDFKMSLFVWLQHSEYQEAYTNYIARLHFYPIMKDSPLWRLTLSLTIPRKSDNTQRTLCVTPEEIAQNQ